MFLTTDPRKITFEDHKELNDVVGMIEYKEATNQEVIVNLKTQMDQFFESQLLSFVGTSKNITNYFKEVLKNETDYFNSIKSIKDEGVLFLPDQQKQKQIASSGIPLTPKQFVTQKKE